MQCCRQLYYIAFGSCVGCRRPVDIRELCKAVSGALRRSNEVHIEYFIRFSGKQSGECESCNRQHRTGEGIPLHGTENWLKESQRTGELFPGRPIVRPGLDFGQDGKDENSKHCRKNYKKSETHSPEIFTVQCVCQYPKVVGASVMLEMESVSTALSSLLSRFKHLPRICYYDNACNMLKSVILRVPWVNNKRFIFCDRFYYKSHTCSSVCDPDSSISCSEHATSGAESVNNLW